MARASPGSRRAGSIGTLMARERPSTTDHPQPRDAREPCHPHGADRYRDRLRGAGARPRARGDRPDVIHLEIGEPDFDTPTHIREAAKRALATGATHYGPAAGLPELREAIVERRREHAGIPVAASRSSSTPGAKPIMFFVIIALANPGDEVVYPNPGFPIYESVINFVGATAGADPAPRGATASASTSTSWRRLSPTRRS